MDNNTIIEFIGCSIADERIQNQSAVVIDVRSLDEFSYGHIPSAVHLSSEQWASEDFVDSIVERFAGATNLIFHCMHSQQRGPTCAKAFMRRLALLTDVEKKPKVSILSGGFSRWEDTYGDDPTKIATLPC